MKYLTFILGVILALNIQAQTYTEVGSGTLSSSYPVYSVWNYGWYAYILPQSSVGSPKTITKIAFNCINGPKTCVNQKIYMAHTSQSIFSSAAYDNPASYTLVFDGTINYNGWTEITFTTPFVYNGSDNLLIQYENRAGSSSYANFNSTASVVNNNKSLGNDPSFPVGTGYLNPYPNSIPNTRLYYSSSNPSTPVCVSPQDNAEKIDLNTSLIFSLGSNTTSYDLYFGTDSTQVANKNTAVKVVENAVVANAGNYSYNPSVILNTGTRYFWKLVAKDGANTSESVVWKFKTQNVIQNFPYVQGFESNDVFYPGWYGFYTDWTYPTSGNEMIWFKSGLSNAHSDTCALTAAPSASVASNNSSIMTPRVFLPPNYRVSFYWRNGSGNKTIGLDTTFFEITSNGGASWNTLGYLSPAAAQSAYVFAQYDLSLYTGDNVYMRWRYKKVSASGKNLYIDDMLIEPIPSGAVLSLNTNSVDFSPITVNAHTHSTVTLTNNGVQNLVISGITVDAPFAASMNQTILPGDSAQLLITLNGSSVGNYTGTLIINSNATGQNNIALSAEVLNASGSFLQTFEGVSVGSLPAEWEKLRSHDPYQVLNDVAVKNSSYDAHSTPNVVRMYNNSDTISPLILLTNGLTNFDTNTLKFYASKTQGNFSDVEITVGLMDDPYDATTFDSILQVVLNDTMTPYAINFAPSNMKPYIAFRHGQKKQMQSVWIDDVQWEGNANTIPNCAGIVFPANSSVDNEVEMLLKWTSTGGAPEGYKLYLGTNNPPTNIVNGADLGDTLSYQVSSLNFSATYYWKVVAYNAIGDANGCETWSFTTMNDPTLSVPWSQGFEGIANIPGFTYPLGWSVINNGDQFNCWDLIANSPTNADNAHTGTNAIHISFSFLNPLDDYLVTPPVQLYSGTDYLLSFWLRAPVYVEGTDSTTEKLEVVFGTGKTTTQLTNIIWSNDALQLPDYEYCQISFNVPADDKYYFSWHAKSDPLQWLTMVDDISMTIDNEVPESNADEIRLFPNPTGSHLYVVVNELIDDNAFINVYNSNGQMVISQQANPKINIINTSLLEQGIYFVNISGNIQGRPFVKQ